MNYSHQDLFANKNYYRVSRNFKDIIKIPFANKKVIHLTNRSFIHYSSEHNDQKMQNVMKKYEKVNDQFLWRGNRWQSVD